MAVYLFPTFNEMYKGEKRKLKRAREYLRYQFRSLYRQEIALFENYLRIHPLWLPLFQQNLYRANVVLETFCDSALNKSARLNAILTNFEIAQSVFAPEICRVLSSGETLTLAELNDNLKICLSANDVDPLEGFWAISLKGEDENIIYHSTFSFIESNGILIASIQGSNQDNAQATIKKATKSLYGVRPMFMLMVVFKLLAQELQLKLFGIPHKRQVKYRWNDHSKLLFNYDDFWAENDSVLNPQGYWEISKDLKFKPLSDIASNKRSMYRKRYAMFEQLAQNLTKVLEI